MGTLNKATLIGYLGHDPEMRYTSAGEPVAHLAVATTETWKDKASGAKREATEWHRVVLYRRLAEIAGEYLKKGSHVYVEGRLQTRKWTGKDGIDRQTTEIIGDDLRMLGARPAGQATAGQSGDAEDDSARVAPESESGRNSASRAEDEIPF
ncbi:MAG: single-stranded DNA-binding protein [Pseudomonadota bacterium]